MATPGTLEIPCTLARTYALRYLFPFLKDIRRICSTCQRRNPALDDITYFLVLLVGEIEVRSQALPRGDNLDVELHDAQKLFWVHGTAPAKFTLQLAAPIVNSEGRYVLRHGFGPELRVVVASPQRASPVFIGVVDILPKEVLQESRDLWR